MSIEDPLPARLSARISGSATCFFACLLAAAPFLVSPVAAVARPAMDESALAELLAGSEDEGEAYRQGTEEADFPGGSRIRDEGEEEDLLDVDARLAAPFRKVKRADLDLENPFDEEVPPQSGAARKTPAKERPAAGVDLSNFASRDLPPEAHLPPSSVRQVRPDRFPFRSALDPADPVDGLKRR